MVLQCVLSTWVTATAAEVESPEGRTVPGAGGHWPGQVELVQQHPPVEDVLLASRTQQCNGVTVCTLGQREGLPHNSPLRSIQTRVPGREE